jgi:hypothetical protein
MPAADFSGMTSFTYRANGGELESTVATVTITVNAVNDPVLDALPTSWLRNMALSLRLSATDVDSTPPA